VALGTIGVYGVSSNTSVRPAVDPEFTSLTRMLEIAREVGGVKHHFRVLQLPMNLYEGGAALERNNGPDLSRTVLEHAAAEGIAVLVNRPLNAMVGEGMQRLADVAETPEAGDLDQQLAVLVTLEEEYRTAIAAHLEAAEGGVAPADFFRWGTDLKGATAHLHGIEHWEALESQRIIPRLLQALQVLDQGLSGPLAEEWHDWRGRYLPALRGALSAVRSHAAARSRARVSEIAARLDPLLPPSRARESLSRKALWVVASTPGVSVVLNGARTPAYVDDALGVLDWPPLPNALAVLEHFRAGGD
jgi:aryl-alcohol dehydrogenase-like predicted oxidoreductase